jgi:hypothetical protein
MKFSETEFLEQLKSLQARLENVQVRFAHLKSHKLFRYPRRVFIGAVAGTLALVLFGLAVFVFGNDFAKNHREAVVYLPTLKQHAPLPPVAPLTFAQTLSMTSLPSDESPLADRCPTQPSNWVTVENAKPSVGVSMDQFKNSKTPWPEGSALWLDKTSVTCGDVVGIHASLVRRVDSSIDNSPRIVQAIRIGWYGGAGGRIVWQSSPLHLKELSTPAPKDARRMIETRWPTTLKLIVGKDWTPGFYLIVTRTSSGQLESSAPLILRAPTGSASLALIHSTLTWAAYNLFGGRSAYQGPGETNAQISYERSRVVSMDRPISGSGNELLFRDAVPLVELAEEAGIPLAQYSDVDLDQTPSLVTNFNGLVFSGHPEYWTERNHDTVIAARNVGINLAFLGGNTAYWRVKLESSPTGKDRHVIIWRNALEDPAKNNADLTTQYSSPLINEPTSLIDGSTTSGIGVYGSMSSTNLPSWLGVPSGSVLNGFSKFSEIEAHQSNNQSPPTVNTLFQGKFTFGGAPIDEETRYKANDVAQMDWFSVPSGAAIFNVGVNLWDCNLEPSCGMGTVDPVTQGLMQTITANVLKKWSVKAAAPTLK